MQNRVQHLEEQPLRTINLTFPILIFMIFFDSYAMVSINSFLCEIMNPRRQNRTKREQMQRERLIIEIAHIFVCSYESHASCKGMQAQGSFYRLLTATRAFTLVVLLS